MIESGWVSSALSWMNDAAFALALPLLSAVSGTLGLSGPWNAVAAAVVVAVGAWIVASLLRLLFSRLSWIVEERTKRLTPREVGSLALSARMKRGFVLFRALRALAFPPRAVGRVLLCLSAIVLLWVGYGGAPGVAEIGRRIDWTALSLGNLVSVTTLLLVCGALLAGGRVRARGAARGIRYQRAIQARYTSAVAADALEFITRQCLPILARGRTEMWDEALAAADAWGESVEVADGRLRVVNPSAYGFRFTNRPDRRRWEGLFFEAEAQAEVIEREFRALAEMGALGQLYGLAPAACRVLIFGFRPTSNAVAMSVPSGAQPSRRVSALPVELIGLEPAFLYERLDARDPDSLVNDLRAQPSREERERVLQADFERITHVAANALWYSMMLRLYADTSAVAVNGRWWERVIERTSGARGA